MERTHESLQLAFIQLNADAASFSNSVNKWQLGRLVLTLGQTAYVVMSNGGSFDLVIPHVALILEYLLMPLVFEFS